MASGESFAHQVSARTDGNPFFIEELLRHVEERSGAGLEAADLPDGVKDLLLRRLRRLGPESEKALVFAAVAGREFDLDVLARVLSIPAEELAELLERAIVGHVLVEEAGAIGGYRFAHPLIREAIYGEVSATRRALAHQRIAEAIESVSTDRLSEQAGALALHYHAAGDAEKALRYHDLAAAKADRAGLRESAADVHAGLAACAVARGDRSAARQLLEGGLRGAGEWGWPGARLALRIALARLASTSAAAAEHLDAAHVLIDQIALSVGNERLAASFRAAALTELQGVPAADAYAAGSSRQVTS